MSDPHKFGFFLSLNLASTWRRYLAQVALSPQRLVRYKLNKENISLYKAEMLLFGNLLTNLLRFFFAIFVVKRYSPSFYTHTYVTSCTALCTYCTLVHTVLQTNQKSFHISWHFPLLFDYLTTQYSTVPTSSILLLRNVFLQYWQ